MAHIMFYVYEKFYYYFQEQFSHKWIKEPQLRNIAVIYRIRLMF